MNKKVLRILDANLNRSREGLRVCEDITRFILNSPSLTKELKLIRHRISAVAKGPSARRSRYFESRNSIEDVGRRPNPKREIKRMNVRDIFCANIERVKESIRVLEEFFKLIDLKISVKFSALRYKVYDIEKRAVKKIEAVRHNR